MLIQSGLDGLTEFDWNEANLDHLSQHKVSPEEAEQAILDPNAVFLEIQIAEDEERTKALGITRTGGILTVVFHVSRHSHPPITAYTASTRLQALYLKRRGA